MIKLSIAALALGLILMGGCAHHHHDSHQSEYRHTESTHTQEGIAPDDQSRQSDSIETHRERTTTTESERR